MKKSYVVMYHYFGLGYQHDLLKPLITFDSRLNAELFCERANDNLRAFGVHRHYLGSSWFKTRYAFTNQGTVISIYDWDYKNGFEVRYPGVGVSIVEVDSYP